MEIKHILIIRFRRIGDSILALTLFHSLRKMFPNAKLDFVLNKEIAPLYENHPDIDRVITYDKEDTQRLFRYLKKTYRVTHDTHYDVIIDMRSTIKTLFFSLFSLSTPYRIGTFKKYSKFIHNYRINDLTSNRLDKIQENLMLLDPLEKEAPIQHVPEFKLYITEKENSTFRSYMEQQGIDFNKPVILAAVTARLSNKVWPIERTKEVLWNIIKKYSDVQIIFNFANNEKEVAVKLHQEMDNSPNIFTNIEAKSLRELCALAKNSDFFYGNEGGPRHLSQSFNVPSFAIFSPNISKVWLPNQGERIQGITIYDIATPEEIEDLNYEQRRELITVDHVWERVDKMLEQFLH